ncbi:conjugal transfer protein TraI [Jannaschia sp. S6380]|uniref:TrbI/VirB10 family protein n=1 Tax=Jannaschia sp. S6380 TaxID=2926408 RepID=UPI001FF4588D|nr:TrbI/VirB10 family protein [Jannaschia sp. S6380]MCK0166211.1 conjugal transfer protein TraI [Jannaschia sp. S6380]
MRLRPDPPRVVRLSRRVLGAGAALVALAIGGMLIVALQSRERSAPAELYRTDNPPTADELTRLPRDYSDIPREVPTLGPPLPGDLGRPILRTQERGQPITPPTIQPVQTLDPEEQRRLAEIEAARTSQLFTQSSSAGQPARSTGLAAQPAPFPDLTGLQPTAEQTATDRRQTFLDAPVDRRVVSGDRIAPPGSPFLLQAGAVIPAALMTGIRSDLPGQVTAQVTQAVYDSPTGGILLIPQGARLLGTYDAEVGAGQSRILLVWTRLILPAGRSITLERLPGADRQGYAGVEDRVDDHWGRVFRAAGLATLIGVGLEAGRDGEDAIADAIRDSAQQTVGTAGERIIQRQLEMPPTLTIRPGTPVNVIVTRDLVLEPLRE